MKLYRFSPIRSENELIEAIKHIHFEAYKLCNQSFGKFLLNSGNIGVFCHYEDEWKFLVGIRKKLTESSENPNQKYFKLHKPIIIPSHKDIPEAVYTHLYIRKPDPYRSHVGDIDFYLEHSEYIKLKKAILEGKEIKGARVFERPDLDMIELYNPDSDALAYVSTEMQTQRVRIKH